MADVLAAAALVVPGAADAPARLHAPGWLAVESGRVVDVGTGRAPAGASDLGDVVLAPGLVDLQVNGVADIDFVAATPAQWRRARAILLRRGVTGSCPTLVTAPAGDYDAMLRAVAAARGDPAPGTRIEGVHLEGPFLGGAPGAHPADLVRPGDPDWLAGLLARHPGLVRMVTLAPEVDPGLACTRLLVEHGVVVALGHSTASYTLARLAADAGATLVTHLFNGMGPLHPREPGLVGAALDDDRLTPTLIADLVHVHPALVRLALARKRAVALVSDAVALPGAGPRPLHEDGAVARLPDGTIAGALLMLDRAVANVVRLAVPLVRAIEVGAIVPARALALDTYGAAGVGGRADLVAFAPAPDLTPRLAWCGGERHVLSPP